MNAPLNSRIEEVLVSMGVVSPIDMRMATAAQERLAMSGEKLAISEVLVRMGLADWNEVERATAQVGTTAAGSNSIALPATVVRNLRVMPVEVRDKKLHYASIHPLSAPEERELLLSARAVGHAVDAVSVYPKSREDVAAWLNRVTYVNHELVEEEAAAICKDTHDGPLMQRFMDHVFQDAIQERASDVHFERSTEAVYCWVSYRIDGMLRRRVSMTQEAMGAICTRLKTIAGLDISESRRPQDGRTAIKYNGRQIDLRISSVPNQDGETVTIRLLDQAQVSRLEHVFRRYPAIEKHLQDLANIRSKSGGVVLVTGPTGQGKSTTLSAFLGAMPRTRLKVMTIEDPVETRIPFVHQSPINVLAGNTYSSLLRAFMRQDPDVLMVGEIRDSETAQEFLKGAETGHMMLSTEHTNDVPSAIGRLVNLLPDELRKPAYFTLASSLRAVLNQRLVPALCVCSAADPSALQRHKTLFSMLGHRSEMNWKLRRHVGCPRCDGTGYYGRELVVEAAFFPASSAMRLEIGKVLSDGVPEDLLKCEGAQVYSRADAVRSLIEEGLIDAETAESALDLALVKDE